jgi:hypothetical protein
MAKARYSRAKLRRSLNVDLKKSNSKEKVSLMSRRVLQLAVKSQQYQLLRGFGEEQYIFVALTVCFS